MFFGFNISKVQAAGFVFEEDFATTDYRDNINTTADWSTGELAFESGDLSLYAATGVFQSLNINPTNDNVAQVRLRVEDEQPSGTSIKYYISANGGNTWVEIAPLRPQPPSDDLGVIIDMVNEKTHIFTNPGKDLRWKAVLSTANNTISPFISDILISTKTVEETMIKIVSPNGGEAWKSGEERNIQWQSARDLRVSFFISKIENGKEPLVKGSTVDVAPGAEWVKWKVPDLPEGEYKISIIGNDVNSFPYSYHDTSDEPFKLVGATPVTTPCKPDGALLRLPNDFKVYVIINCQKKLIKTAEELEMAGHKWSDIQEVSISTLNNHPDSIGAMPAAATLLRVDGDYKIYRIIGGKRLWIPTVAAFNAQGLKWNDTQQINTAALNGYERAKLLRIDGGSRVYYITEAGYKRHIINPQVFLSYGNKWEDIIDVSFETLNSYPDNPLIRGQGDYKVYKLENGQKRWIKSAEAFNKLGLDWSNIAPINSMEFNAYPAEAPIE